MTVAGHELYTLDATAAGELGRFAGSDSEVRLAWEIKQVGDRRRHHLLHVEPIDSGECVLMRTILARQVFQTSRLLEYFSEKELTLQTGHEPEHWADVILKELLDNALDACETPRSCRTLR